MSLILGCVPPNQTKTVLRVPLYPYIPDAAGDQFKAMAARIETEFERTHPDIDLVLNPSCFKDDFYEPAQIARSLKGEGECGYDVIETDTAILGELVAEGGVRPWPQLPKNIDWHPSGVAASTHMEQNALYGVPHWLCGHFVMSRDESVRQAGTASALVQALEARRTAVPDMAVNLLGSWNLPSLYLDAWADAKGLEGLRSAVTTSSYDPEVLQSLRAFASTCDASGSNPCLDGTYDLEENADLPARLFAENKADATAGYSERLHVILKNLPAGESPSAIKISSAPLAEGSRPILFTDSFFLGVRCTDECEKAALEFVQYMSQASTFEWILMSGDAPEGARVPRYLLPAALDVYKAPGLRADPFYPTLAAETRNGGPFPNSGLYGIRKDMRDAIKLELTRPITAAP
jgi:thiamine pyridinylase